MVLFVGRIEPLKGLDVLLEAIALLREQGKWDKNPFCLMVIGGDPEASEGEKSSEMARIQALRETYNLQDLVVFEGKRSQDTLPYYYSAAEAVVVPSHYESFGMVALEAMACGTPVVASEEAPGYLVQDGVTGFTVPVDEPQALADRLYQLLDDNELRARMSKQAVTAAQDYSWWNIANRLKAVYQDLLGKELERTVEERRVDL
jgi:D-inositol-3-phosphate glycosyltransferase